MSERERVKDREGVREREREREERFRKRGRERKSLTRRTKDHKHGNRYCFPNMKNMFDEAII